MRAGWQAQFIGKYLRKEYAQFFCLDNVFRFSLSIQIVSVGGGWYYGRGEHLKF